jgi:hypothetical protein
VTVAGQDCHFHIFAKPKTACDQGARLPHQGRGQLRAGAAQGPWVAVATTIAGERLVGFDEAAYRDALDAAGYPAGPDPARVNLPVTLLLLVVLMLYVTMCTARSRPISSSYSGTHPLFVDEPAVPHRQRLVRRVPAVPRGVPSSC